jgi:iron complex outermembrane receptor protein
LLQQTVLNQQLIKQRDWGSDFGVKWDVDQGRLDQQPHRGREWSTPLTRTTTSPASPPVTNDVVNQSNIYDIVALNSGAPCWAR